MGTQDDAVFFAYSGFDGLWKNIAVWGIVGGTCAFISPIPFDILAFVIVGGLAIAGLMAFFLYRLKTRWIEPARWLGLLMAVLWTISKGTISNGAGFLAVGSFLSVSIDVGLAIFGRISLDKLNQKYLRHATAGDVEKMFRSSPELDASPRSYPELDESSTRNAFLEALPQPLRDEMAATFVPVTAIDVGTPSTTLPPEASSYGGCPLLQPGENWPTHQGKPLDFLAQINLAEVVDFLPEGIPPQGLLSFFYAHEQPWGGEAGDQGSAGIIYAPDPAACIPVEPQTGGASRPRQGLTFRTETGQQIPDDLEERFYHHFRSLKGDARSLLDHLHDRVMELNPFNNRLLSTPALVQNSMEEELRVAAKAYGLDADTPWTMILQIDSVEEQDWCWGDAGCVYFWIPTEDLRAVRFDRPWAVLQCS